MKKMRLLIGLVLLFTLCSAMAFGSGTSTSTKMELLWLGHIHVRTEPPPPDDNPIQAILEKRFNVDIKNVPINNTEAEKFMLYFAEGSTADRITLGDRGTFTKMVDQGLLRTVKEEWLWDKMPKWMGLVQSMTGKEMLESQLKYKGEVWGVSNINYSSFVPRVSLLRLDWMKKVGITKMPENLDETFELFKRFTFEDPDGNGKDDTYGTDDYKHKWRHFVFVMGAYGIQYNSYYVRDGKTVYTSALPEYKEVLTLLNQWYEAGVIDPEFVTDDGTTQRRKWRESKFGYISIHPWFFEKATPENVIYPILEEIPTAEFGRVPAPIGPTGLAGYGAGYPNLIDKYQITFGHTTSDEKVQKIMEIEEALAADRELYRTAYHGIEGTHWDWVDGVVTYNPDVTNPQRNRDGLGQFYALIPMTFEIASETMTPKDKWYYESAVVQPISHYGIAFPLLGTNEAAKEKEADIDTVASEFFYKAVAGHIDIDSEWDGYIKDLEKAGLTEILEEYDSIR